MAVLGPMDFIRREIVRRAFTVSTPKLTGGQQLGFFTPLTWRVPPDRSLADYLALYGQVGWLFAVTNKIAQTVAHVPWKIVQVVGEQNEKIELPNTHPAARMLRMVNPHWTNSDLFQMTQLYLDLTGEAFWFIIRDMRGNPRMMWTLPPHRVQVLPSDDVTQFIRGYVYISPIGDQIPISPSDVIFFRTPNPLNIYRGLGPVQASMLDVDLELFAAQYARNFYFNNAAPGGIINIPGGWNEAEFERVREQVESRHQGAPNAGRLMILWGQMQWQAAEISAKDLQLIELRKLTRNNIIGLFGVPLSVLGIVEDVNRANAEAGYYVYSKEVITPRLNKIKATIDQFFLPMFGQGLEIEFAHVIPEDEATRTVRAVQGFQQGIMSLNEARESLGLDVIEDGDFVLLPMGSALGEAYSTLENADEPPPDGDGQAAPTKPPQGGPDDENMEEDEQAELKKQRRPGNAPATADNPGGTARTEPLRAMSGGRVRFDIKKVDKRKKRQRVSPDGEGDGVLIEITDADGLVAPQVRFADQDWEARGQAHWETVQSGLGGPERSFAEELGRVFDRFIDDVVTRLHGMLAVPRLIEGNEETRHVDQLADWRDHGARLEVVLVRGLTEGRHSGRLAAAATLGKTFTSHRDADEAWARRHAAEKVKGLTATSRKQLASFVESGLREGKNVQAVTDEISKAFRTMTEHRAQTIARTELQEAAAEGTKAQYAEEGVERMEFYTALDERVCPYCEALHGEIADVDGTFSSGDDGPPIHPDCLVAGTVVLAPEVIAVTDRLYAGPIVELLMRSGRRLTVTPNHPLLTPEGWVPARAVDEGGYLLRAVHSQRVATGINPYHRDVPARVEQVADALRRTCPVPSIAMPTSAEDFHGDGVGSQVHVVTPNGLLWNRRDAPLRQQAHQCPFCGRHEPRGLSRPRDFEAMLLRLGRAADGVMGGAGVGAALLGRPRGGQQAVRAGATAYGNSGVAQGASEPCARMPERAAQCGGAFSPQVSAEDAGGDGMPPSHRFHAAPLEHAVEGCRADPKLLEELRDGLPGLVTCDEIVGVRNLEFRGHVYNLESATGWYMANDIIAHNCRCALLPVVEAQAAVPAEGSLVIERAAKMSKVLAGYVAADENSGGQRCSGCQYFEMGICDKVEGYIEGGGWCRLFEAGRRPAVKGNEGGPTPVTAVEGARDAAASEGTGPTGGFLVQPNDPKAGRKPARKPKNKWQTHLVGQKKKPHTDPEDEKPSGEVRE